MGQNPLGLLAAGLIALSAAACSQVNLPVLDGPQSIAYDREAKRYAERDGKAEAAAAFAKHDFHFITAMGYAEFMPGVSPDLASDLRQRFGTESLSGIGDAIKSKAHRRYIEIATCYAAVYNQELLRLLRRDGKVR